MLYGIWVWDGMLDATEHALQVVRVVTKFETPEVVLLKVKYESEDEFKTQFGQTVEITHETAIGNIVLIESRKAKLLGRDIPPDRISVVDSWNLEESLWPRKK